MYNFFLAHRSDRLSWAIALFTAANLILAVTAHVTENWIIVQVALSAWFPLGMAAVAGVLYGCARDIVLRAAERLPDGRFE